MIKLTLDQYMKREGLSIQDVAERTGLSRNTISQLYNNTGKGIQFETLDRLTNYLDISLYEILEKKFLITDFVFTVTYSLENEEQNEFSVDFSNNNEKLFSIEFSIDIFGENDKLQYYAIRNNEFQFDDFSETLYAISDFFNNFEYHILEKNFALISAEIINQFEKGKISKDPLPTNVLLTLKSIDISYSTFFWSTEWISTIDVLDEYIDTKYELFKIPEGIEIDEYGDLKH